MDAKLSMTRGDMILIVGLLCLCAVWLGSTLAGVRQGQVVEIFSGDGQSLTLPLDQDTSVHIDGPLGQSEVVIADGAVFMRSSPCPHQLCIRMGPIRNAGSTIVCIPNRVSVRIRGNPQGIDAVSY